MGVPSGSKITHSCPADSVLNKFGCFTSGNCFVISAAIRGNSLVETVTPYPTCVYMPGVPSQPSEPFRESRLAPASVVRLSHEPNPGFAPGRYIVWMVG